MTTQPITMRESQHATSAAIAARMRHSHVEDTSPILVGAVWVAFAWFLVALALHSFYKNTLVRVMIVLSALTFLVLGSTVH